MKAHKFVADFGIEKAKRVLEGAPKDSLYLNQLTGFYYKIKCDDVMYGSDDESKGGWVVSTWLIEDLGRSKHTISLEKLKQVVESFENIEFYGGFEEVKFKIRRAELNGWLCISVAHEDGFAEWYLEGAKKAIADYEVVESYKENQHV